MRRAILAASLIVPGLIVGLLAQQITLPPVQTPNKTANDHMTLGWLDETTAGANAAAVDLACDAYCEFWGLEPGEMAQHIAGRGCMVPDMLIEEANWPQSCRHDLGMYIDWQGFRESTMGMPRAEAEDLFSQALMEWNNSIGVKLHITTDLAAAKCYVSWQGLGGSTLAWSHLADNSCSDDKKQRYDIRRWSKHQFYQTVSLEERKRRRDEWSAAYFAAVQRNPYQTGKTEIMLDVLLALRNDEDPAEPTNSKVLKSTRQIRNQIVLWRKHNPNGDISELESIDELPEPDEPEDPGSERAS